MRIASLGSSCDTYRIIVGGLIRDRFAEIHPSGLTTSHSVAPANGVGRSEYEAYYLVWNEGQVPENTGYSTNRTMRVSLQRRLCGLKCGVVALRKQTDNNKTRVHNSTLDHR